MEDVRLEIEEELAELDITNDDIDAAYHVTDEGSNMQIQHFRKLKIFITNMKYHF